MKSEKIEIIGRFKTVNLFNETLHIIIYPEDGLHVANKLYSLEDGTKIKITIDKENDWTLLENYECPKCGKKQVIQHLQTGDMNCKKCNWTTIH